MSNSYSFQRPRKRFGQNFLHDQNVLGKMVAAISPQHNDPVIEIGPGQGALTFPLLEKLGKLTAIELDRDLIAPLNALTPKEQTLTIINEDALRFDFNRLASAENPIRVVGNLPYNISTPLIFHLLQHSELIIDMHFLLQKEVVDRIAAAPGSKDYGRLSVMVQYQCSALKLFHVLPGAFNPPPKVDSAFIRIIPAAEPPYLADDFRTLSRLVKLCFSQRRKTLRRILKNEVNDQMFIATDIDSGLRPERLSVSDFVNLSNQITLASTDGGNV